MRAKFRLPRSGMALSAVLSGVALLAGAQVASADTSAHPAAGVLKLSNVRIEMAGPSRIAEAAIAAQSAVRAYKDPVTGELRDQTPEEMLSSGTSKAAPKSLAKSATFTTAKGGVGMHLDESYMSNAVAGKDADGRMNMQCVTGHDVADALEGKAGKAHRHDH